VNDTHKGQYIKPMKVVVPSLLNAGIAVAKGVVLRFSNSALLVSLLVAGFLSAPTIAGDMVQGSGLHFEVSFGKSLNKKPITGRMFIAVSPTNKSEPRIASYTSSKMRDGKSPYFATDVDELKPGERFVVDSRATGFPMWSLKDLPAGDYYVQALFHVYTEFKRSDGHEIWAPMDQWEGQRWAFSPGNLVSTPKLVHLDPSKDDKIIIELNDTIPPIPEAKDTKWVKHVKFKSKMLSKFWGHPIYLGATVVVPKGYDENSNTYYPVVYDQQHFTTKPGLNFSETPPKINPIYKKMLAETGGKQDDGFDLYKAWSGDSFPRMFMIRFLHPTPYFDDSYGVNSANNGPYGDALLEELIPYLEKKFRIIKEPYARVLTGGSTGGWISLALQLYHPKFFNGTWSFFPDPIDFRNYQLSNVYEDDSAFIVPGAGPGAPERMAQRTTGGQPVLTVRQGSHLELAQGTRGRSGGQLDIWNATYGPVGEDGYPRVLWDKKTGKIDHEVAEYMRDNGYDLRHYAEKNWPKIGKDLVGKIHIYNPEMDQYYLPYAVYRMEDFLESTENPYYGGEVHHGRPKAGHGWRLDTRPDMLRSMAERIVNTAPAGTDTSGWMER